jgi:hypothetical protein
VRHHQAHEADRTGEGHHAGRQQGRAQEHAELEALGVDAELERRLLAESQHIELAGLAQDQPDAEGGQPGEHPERPRRDRADVAEEPVHDAP